MTKPQAGVAAVDKAVGLFLAVLNNVGMPLSDIAAKQGLPLSTAHRMVASLLRHGLLSRTGRGSYAPGLVLAGMAKRANTRDVLVRCARPVLRHLARALGTTVHLGVLEGDMVTYLVKEHACGRQLRTGEATQLEAYCTGIGKVLLAHLAEAERTFYLAEGPFVQITAATITDPAALKAHLVQVAAQGFATDRAEFEEGLYCLAVPVRGPSDRVVAALSASGFGGSCAEATWLAPLQLAAARVGRNLGAVS